MKASMLGSLLLFLLSFAHGGEWHSIGAAPTPPYIPPFKVDYTCEMRVDHGRGHLTKNESKTIEFHDADFREWGRASATFEGQTISLSFEPEDRVNLTIYLKLGAATSYGTHAGARGRQSLSVGNRSVTVTATCTKI